MSKRMSMNKVLVAAGGAAVPRSDTATCPVCGEKEVPLRRPGRYMFMTRSAWLRARRTVLCYHEDVTGAICKGGGCMVVEEIATGQKGEKR